ncbi:MAG: YlbE-like family protein [Bacilli bacterium]|nr:YlbE-like family protein [Bacilli bacterium]
MTLDVQFKLKSDPNYIKYIRENSYWYKTLNRHPELFDEFVEEVKDKYKLRFSDRLTKTLENVEMIQSVLSSLQ